MRKRYPAYKASGIDWLGQIPKDWIVRKLKYNTYIKARVGWHGLNSDEFGTEGVHCVTGADFFKGQVDWNKCYRIGEDRYNEDPYIQLEEADLLITKDGTIGKTAVANRVPGRATLNSGIFVVRPEKDYTTSFLYWALQSSLFTEFVNYNAKGTTINHLYQDAFSNMPLLIPSLPEQNAIVSYLSNKTTQIDETIQKKQRLIELLHEEQAAVITRAVTRGIDGAVTLKSSGIEWLGDIPVNWKVKRLKYISPSISVGLVINPSTYYDPEGTIPLITGKNVHPFYIDTANAGTITEISNNLLKKTQVYTNDIVTIRVGYPGVSAVVPSHLSGINCASMVIIRKGDYNPGFLTYCLNSRIGMSQVEQVQYGAAQKQFNIGHAIDFQFPVPCQEEQAIITEYLNKVQNNTEKVIVKIHQEINLLQEYRTALINEVVTGKTCVI